MASEFDRSLAALLGNLPSLDESFGHSPANGASQLSLLSETRVRSL